MIETNGYERYYTTKALTQYHKSTKTYNGAGRGDSARERVGRGSAVHSLTDRQQALPTPTPPSSSPHSPTH